MQDQRGNLHPLGLVDEAGTYLASQWHPTPVLSRQQLRRVRARSATWNVTAAAVLLSSLGIYVCGLIFLVHLI